MNDALEKIAKVAYHVACTCCSSDDEYVSRVNEVGALIDGRTWVKNYDPKTLEAIYTTVKP